MKQDLSSRATTGLTFKDSDLEPNTESKSEGVALGVDGEESLDKNRGADDEAVRENERKSANLKERNGLFKTIYPLSLWPLKMELTCEPNGA